MYIPVSQHEADLSGSILFAKSKTYFQLILQVLKLTERKTPYQQQSKF